MVEPDALLDTLGPGFDPVFGAQATFRVLLDAMARPGTIRRLPAADPTSPLVAARPLTALLQTLLDHEVGFAVVTASEHDAERLTAHLAETTGSRAVTVEEADYVVTLAPLPAGLPLRLKRGEPAYPDQGATLICLLPPLDVERADQIVLSLAGPGVRPGVDATLRLSGLTIADLTALAAANAEPPCGVDLILVDEAGLVVCLPRSAKLTIKRE